MVFLAAFATAEYNEKHRQRQGDASGDDAIADCTDDLTELAFDDHQQYQKQVTKWIKGSLTALQDPMFWFFVHVSYRAREPIRHLFNILSKYGSWQSSQAFKNQTRSSELPVVDLVTRRIPELDKEFHALGQSVGSWTNDIIANLHQMSIWCNHDDTLDSACMKAIAIRVVLHNHTAFRRRIVTIFSKWLH